MQCFVFIVNQPMVTELEQLYKSSIQGIVVENTLLKQVLDQIYSTGPEFKNCVEKVFEIDIKRHNHERWISGDFFSLKITFTSADVVCSEMVEKFSN